MKKNILLLPVLFILNFCAAQYPTSFAWPVTDSKDQKETGPCNVFATTAAVESWYKILYSIPVLLSEAHLYSPCGGANPFPSTSISNAMNFFKVTGVVSSDCLPYSTPTGCTGTNPPAQAKYFGFKLGNQTTSPPVTNPLLYNNDCGTPWCNCTPNNFPGYRFRVGDYSTLSIAAMINSNDLKRAIMNLGPVVLRMRVNNSSYPELHVGRNHTYLLYGWQANGNWMLKDSWEGQANVNNSTAFNIVDFFRNSGDGEAWIIKKGTGIDAVYRQLYTPPPANSWANNNPPLICSNSAYSNAFTISSPNSITAVASTVSVNNLGLLDNPVVEWSFETTNGAAVSFNPNPPLGPSVSVTSVTSGTGNLVAKIKRPNGLCETIRRAVSVSSGSQIPFTYSKTSDLCIGSTRRIVYQVTSPYPIQCAWDFRPSPGGSYTYTISGCTFTMNYTSFNTSYGLLVNITSPSFPGVTNSATAGGPVLQCGGGNRPIIKDPVILPVTTSVNIFPNPVIEKLEITLPPQNLYRIVMFNIDGRMTFSKVSAKTMQIDVRNFNKGVYIMKVASLNGTEDVFIKKIVIQ